MRIPTRIGLALLVLVALGSACGPATSAEGQDAIKVTATPTATATPTPAPTPEPTPAPSQLTVELGRTFWAGAMGVFPMSIRLQPDRDPDSGLWTVELGSLRMFCTPTPTADGWHLDQCDGMVPDFVVTFDVPREADGAMPFELVDSTLEPPVTRSGSMRRVTTRDEEQAERVVRNWRSRNAALGSNTDVWSEDGVVFAPHFGGHVELLSAATGERLGMIDINVVLGIGGRPTAALDVKARDQLLYVATGSGGVLIYDVSIASQPEIVGQYVVVAAEGSPDGATNIHNIFLAPERDILYLINQTASDLRLIDVSNPAAPFEVGRYSVENPLEEALFPHDVNVVIRDGREIAFVNYWDAGVRILDTTDPGAIVEVGVWDVDDVHSHAGWPFEVNGRQYYAHGGEGYDQHLTILDITELADPRVVGRYRSRDGISIHNLEVRDGFAYIAYYLDGLRVVDLRDPANPVEVAHYNTVAPGREAALFQGAWGVRLEGDRVFVSDLESGVFSLTVELPED